MSIGKSRRERTRNAILDAAVDLFLERRPNSGIEVRLQDIARRAGVSRRSIYVHFGSRPGLLVEMVQHFDARGILDGLVRSVLDAPTPRDALDAIGHLHAEYSPVAYPVASVLMRGRHTDDALRAAWNDRMAARREVYLSVVRRLEDGDLLAPEWEVQAAADLMSALTSWQVWEQLVVEHGWSKGRYREYLQTGLRRLLIADGEP